jgi:sarcosine oxidase subunit gamma
MSDIALSRPAPSGRAIFRCRPAALESAGRAFGIDLPQAACTAAQSGDRAALWLGPDEWLLLFPPDQRDTVDAAFRETFGELPYSLVDVGERQVGFALEGPRATSLLNCGCPLDFDEMPIGFCSRTMLGKAEIVLWRKGAHSFHIEVWLSFASYVSLLLAEAGREFGLA